MKGRTVKGMQGVMDESKKLGNSAKSKQSKKKMLQSGMCGLLAVTCGSRSERKEMKAEMAKG